MSTKEILFESMKQFCKNTSGKCRNAFFENWFTKNGKTYNFIFKQNLYVTNIQYRELIDLIQLNTTRESKRVQINFMTTKDFFDFMSNIIESFIDMNCLRKIRENTCEIELVSNDLERLCKNYLNIFENIVVVDSFYTSCIVSIPNGMVMDIQQICFQSGYIHSCGENIYTRNMKKAKYDSFVSRLEEYIDNSDNILNFIMYTHEDYPIKNKLYVNDFQKHGLDEIKFYLEKFYMQDISLLQVVEKLKSNGNLKNKIRIVSRSEAKRTQANECIWMIIDRSISEDLKYPGERRYYICYKQMYINENPFHIFDENKPGWIDSVTIPHTLMGAMLNIGLAGCLINERDKYIVVDPFVGTGTTLLETLKYTKIDFWGGDKCAITQIVSELNLIFFAMKKSSLNKIQNIVLEIIDVGDSAKCQKIISDLQIKNYSSEKWHDLAVCISGYLTNCINDFVLKGFEFETKFCSLTEDLYNEIKNSKKNSGLSNEECCLISKVCLLIVWKTFKRKEFIYRKNSNQENSFIKEVAEEFKGFLYRLISYIHIRERIKDNANDEERIIVYNGKYTRACSINSNYIKNNITVESSKIKQNIDIIDFLKGLQNEQKKVDLIITDPPYGFNTIEDKNSFAELYINFIEEMVKTINNGGQIIMCLPAWSYSGKTVNFFAQKEVVSRQFMIAAQRNNMYIAEKKEVLTEPTKLFEFPFYWDSEKALRRDIVKFQFFKRS
ncbi:MAG: hypothetical protein IJ716_12220 [Lachnospiraceae bacterium]|nr:hypothetical protein [Lachnospiraceae bacterium]